MVNLEVSVITDEFSLEFDEVCEYLAGLGLKYIELRQVWLGNVCEVDDQTLSDAKDVINDNGLKVSSIAGPLLKCYPPSVYPDPVEKTNYTKNWKYNYSKFPHILEIAEMYDAPYIRIFAYEGTKSEDHPWEVPPVEEWDNWQIYKDWSEIVTEFKGKAAKKGKTLICENDSGFNTVFVQMEKIGKDHCDDSFGLLLDTGNVGKKGPEGILTPEWMDRLFPLVKYIHAKGVCVSEDGSRNICPVNSEKDAVGWPAIIERLMDMKPEEFVGKAPDPLFISIETHMGKKNRWENSERSLKNLLKLMEEMGAL